MGILYIIGIIVLQYNVITAQPIELSPLVLQQNPEVGLNQLLVVKVVQMVPALAVEKLCGSFPRRMA